MVSTLWARWANSRRIHRETNERELFASKIVPVRLQASPEVVAVLPLLYLSAVDFPYPWVAPPHAEVQPHDA